MTIRHGFVRRIGFRARHLPALLVPLVLGAGLATTAAAKSDILSVAELHARVSIGGFEFRGTASMGSGSYLEHHIWRFQPDGSIVDVGTVGHLWYLSGYTEQPIPTTRGTWKLNANQICVELKENDGGLYTPVANRLNGCYDVLSGRGNQVSLVGPQIFNGTLEPLPAAAQPPVAAVPAPKPRAHRRGHATTTKRQHP